MDEKERGKDETSSPKPSREDEARQVVREYIDDQKALIKKLRSEQ